MSAALTIADWLSAEPRSETLLPDPKFEPTISVEQAAKILGVSRGLAYQAVRWGQLPALRIGRRLRVPTAPLLRLIDSHLQADHPKPVGGLPTPGGTEEMRTVPKDPPEAQSQELPSGWPSRRQELRR